MIDTIEKAKQMKRMMKASIARDTNILECSPIRRLSSSFLNPLTTDSIVWCTCNQFLPFFASLPLSPCGLEAHIYPCCVSCFMWAMLVLLV